MGQERPERLGGGLEAERGEGRDETAPGSTGHGPLAPSAGECDSSLRPGQYTSIVFGSRCREAGVRPSMGSVGDCFDCASRSSPRWSASCWPGTRSARRTKLRHRCSSTSRAGTTRTGGILQSTISRRSAMKGSTSASPARPPRKSASQDARRATISRCPGSRARARALQSSWADSPPGRAPQVPNHPRNRGNSSSPPRQSTGRFARAALRRGNRATRRRPIPNGSVPETLSPPTLGWALPPPP